MSQPAAEAVPRPAFPRARLPEVTPVDPGALRDLALELTRLFGEDAVSRDEPARLTASTDWAHMSPVLQPMLPGGVADLVVRPGDAAGIAAAVGAAHRHRVPVTTRGQGTGNYGQGIPLFGGLVLDTSRATKVLAVEDGWITAEAGASFVLMEKAALATGQELAIMPSTVGSTIGGFIAGGAGGTGSIANGAVWDGYIRSLSVVPCTDDATPVDVPYPDNTAQSHAFGVSGVIATATVALRPARRWTALFASFSDFDAAVSAGEELFELEPTPRLLSLDEAGVVATYRPVDPAMPPDRLSVRGIITEDSVAAASAVVERHGGRVDAVRPKGPALVTSLSYNHTTYRVRKLRPELTHLQCGGDGLTRRRAEVAAVAPESLIHLEGFASPGGGRHWAGMLFLRFDDVDTLYDRMTRLADVDVFVNDPHTWVLKNRVDQIRAAAARFDPDGLLNPGKLPPPS
ncbi:FAD-binding oxidoreductase [Frankia sp. CNm7]|uniref:FAD-binding oxidoreductase n=2 Tax=Frankia nepalensis TaxID=1836974 RepID=A0A937RAQ8_9ACTN|nr:FAD-binding protein [Frankia nepalensis]MBL7500099.1 FAD-binding oxidoreductase [Frankia nepalensis]MBL7512444.1 FAD-binding oxidoreductase [Frankia nepalensis]MBL7523753.1 FAD-binding oxidoreductase [Frankia nepalensis]MBL7628581.1 FAD-binding oxidoreductase [Frankia nepalensis]